MQSAAVSGPPPSDPLRMSVCHLLTKGCSLPCSTAAQAFTQLVPSTVRFQVALDALLPLLDSGVQPERRILASYLLYALYAPWPIEMNPFQSALHDTYLKERESSMNSTTSDQEGAEDNEQLVWVLWKILKGDGNDLGPYNPSTLARSPLPPKLKAANLTLDARPAPICDENRQEMMGPAGMSPSLETSQNGAHEVPITNEEDDRNRSITNAMSLLLAARRRVLTLSEQRIVTNHIPDLTNPPMLTSTDLPSLIAFNPTLAHPVLVGLLTSSPNASTYLDVLKSLPPSLATFDLLGRLLVDPTMLIDSSTGGRTTVVDLVRSEVLGAFVHESIRWLEKTKQAEEGGLINDDRFAKGVQHLCRFYSSLIRLSIVDPSSDAESAEIMHFTLLNARFEEANSLYRILAQSHF